MTATTNPFSPNFTGNITPLNPFKLQPAPWQPARSAWDAAYLAATQEFCCDPLKATDAAFITTPNFAQMVASAGAYLELSFPAHAAELARAAAIVVSLEQRRILALEHDLGIPQYDPAVEFADEDQSDSEGSDYALPPDFFPGDAQEPRRPLGEAVELALARALEQCQRHDSPEILERIKSTRKDVAHHRASQCAWNVLRPVLSRESIPGMACLLAAEAWNTHAGIVMCPQQSEHTLSETIELAFAKALEQCRRSATVELLQLFGMDREKLALARAQRAIVKSIRLPFSYENEALMAELLAKAAWETVQR